MTIKEQLTESIYKWVAGNGKVTADRQKLFKMMIQATLDYLYLNGFLKEVSEKNGKSNKVEKLAN